MNPDPDWIIFKKPKGKELMKKTISFLLFCILFLIITTAFSSADSFEAKDCTPLETDVQKEEAISIALAALYDRFDLPEGELERLPCEARFVSYVDLKGRVDGEPRWEIRMGRRHVILDRQGKPVEVNGGGRDIPWESDTLAASKTVEPMACDGTAEEAIALAWEMIDDAQAPWGGDRSGITANAELILNENFCVGSEPVWLVTFSGEEPLYKILLRWDMVFISKAKWGKEFSYEGMPKWVEQKNDYFPHGVPNFGMWTQEEQAAFSEKYIPIVESMAQENPHLADKDNDMYWLTRHRYGVPTEGMISLKEAKEAARELCIAEGAATETYDKRVTEAALDITKPEKPIWRLLIGYDRECEPVDFSWFSVQINALTGEVTTLRMDHNMFREQDIW